MHEGIRSSSPMVPARGELDGASLGSPVSIILTMMDRAGDGPALHRHPYSETFVVRVGRVAFSDDVRTWEAEAGQIVVVPADTPHRFVGLTEHVEMIDIHASPTFITEWLCSASAPSVSASPPPLARVRGL